MNLQKTAIDSFMNIASTDKDLLDIAQKMIEVNNKEIDEKEYSKENTELLQKYPKEILVIETKEIVISAIGKNKTQISFKNILLNRLLSIGLLKILDKRQQKCSNEELNSYQYMIQVFNNYN